MKIRRYYRMVGTVQGVGFRYRARYAAEALGITGFVEFCGELLGWLGTNGGPGNR